jgi:iron only hydrogenase large subunit-like protein
MCCEGGCVGGNATIKNQRDARKMIDELAAKSKEIEKIK